MHVENESFVLSDVDFEAKKGVFSLSDVGFGLSKVVFEQSKDSPDLSKVEVEQLEEFLYFSIDQKKALDGLFARLDAGVRKWNGR